LSKTKIQCLYGNQLTTAMAQVGADAVEVVDSFNYRGCLLSSTSGSEQEIRRQIGLTRNFTARVLYFRLEFAFKHLTLMRFWGLCPRPPPRIVYLDPDSVLSPKSPVCLVLGMLPGPRDSKD